MKQIALGLLLDEIKARISYLELNNIGEKEREELLKELNRLIGGD